MSEGLSIRPAGESDWPEILALANRAVPGSPNNNRKWLAERQNFDSTSWAQRRYVAITRNSIEGFATLEEGPQSHHFRIYLIMTDENLKSCVAAILINRLLRDLADFNATRIWARADSKRKTFYHLFTALGLDFAHHCTAKHGSEDIVMERDLSTPLIRPPILPEDMVARLVGSDHQQAVTWVAHIGEILAQCAARFDLEIDTPPFQPAINYVVPAHGTNGEELILKIGLPGADWEREVETLEFYAGRGSARLIDSDAGLGALVLEKLEPGIPIATIENDEEATRIAARVMCKLWQSLPTNHHFRTIEDTWSPYFDQVRYHLKNGTCPLPRSLVDQAQYLFVAYLADNQQHVLLHGDLHHWNILSAHREPHLAIDPKGYAGEPTCEVGPLLGNRLFDRPDPAGTTERRIAILSEDLGIERERIAGWHLIQSVLHAEWSTSIKFDSTWTQTRIRNAEIANQLL